MAQDAQRPARHTRQSSRITTLVTGSWKPQDARNATEVEKFSRQDDATTKYIKRTLCAPNTRSNLFAQDIESKPLGELLPPLTSSNEVDLQLYALIATIINQFVQAWYNKITPDQDFVAEVVKIIAHCTRGFEQRLRNVDLEALVLDELPLIVESHIEAVRKADETSNTSIFSGDTRIIFHTLRKHVALDPPPISPEAEVILQDNEIAWSRLLVDRLMPLLLPPEDLQNPCLKVLVADIFAEMVVRNGVYGKTCESWLTWEGLTKIVYLLRPETVPSQETTKDISPVSRLEQFGLLAANPSASDSEKPQLNGVVDSILSMIWIILQYTASVFTILRSFTLSLIHASSLPARNTVVANPITPASTEVEKSRQASPDVGLEAIQSHLEPSRPRPIIAMGLWSCISVVLSVKQRMPWLSGLLSLLQTTSLNGPGRVCQANGALDR
ncbi:hypothetical protein K431DRAFT_294073 [Polychaeton citri CBS 116435]|uniref:PXA domain-containing protein n=1 Tax=Polychaeton citri CBS 116435 TaxID=1314669 RepID=A0A9P4Q933_9PEZI|nr:hypothetical protein K431DRAFT_294073 [Polychaeton citri CBS 116435]